jgi:hypothetical protein
MVLTKQQVSDQMTPPPFAVAWRKSYPAEAQQKGLACIRGDHPAHAKKWALDLQQ